MGDHPGRARSLGTRPQQPKRSLTRFGTGEDEATAHKKASWQQSHLTSNPAPGPSPVSGLCQVPGVGSLRGVARLAPEVGTVMLTRWPRQHALTHDTCLGDWGCFLNGEAGVRPQQEQEHWETSSAKDCSHPPRFWPWDAAITLRWRPVRIHTIISLACSSTPCRRQTKFIDLDSWNVQQKTTATWEVDIIWDTEQRRRLGDPDPLCAKRYPEISGNPSHD